jgi:hypothetical protein
MHAGNGDGKRRGIKGRDDLWRPPPTEGKSIRWAELSGGPETGKRCGPAWVQGQGLKCCLCQPGQKAGRLDKGGGQGSMHCALGRDDWCVSGSSRECGLGSPVAGEKRGGGGGRQGRPGERQSCTRAVQTRAASRQHNWAELNRAAQLPCAVRAGLLTHSAA